SEIRKPHSRFRFARSRLRSPRKQAREPAPDHPPDQRYAAKTMGRRHGFAAQPRLEVAADGLGDFGCEYPHDRSAAELRQRSGQRIAYGEEDGAGLRSIRVEAKIGSRGQPSPARRIVSLPDDSTGERRNVIGHRRGSGKPRLDRSERYEHLALDASVTRRYHS